MGTRIGLVSLPEHHLRNDPLGRIAMPYKDPIKRAEYEKEYREKNRLLLAEKRIERAGYQKEYREKNREKLIAQMRIYYKENRIKLAETKKKKLEMLSKEEALELATNKKEYMKEYNKNNRYKLNEWKKEWRKKNPEKVKEMAARSRVNNSENIREWHKKDAQNAKTDCMNAYGGKCVCCGESELTFLTIDHINGTSLKKNQSYRLGTSLYKWLRRNNYPRDNFRILCCNCNYSCGFFGYCPHGNLPPIENSKANNRDEYMEYIVSDYYRKYANKVRLECIYAYGCKCACCGISEWEFLALDHIHGDGKEDRKKTGGSPQSFYVSLRNQDYPKDRYRLLCHSCNYAKGHTNRRCPHEGLIINT